MNKAARKHQVEISAKKRSFEVKNLDLLFRVKEFVEERFELGKTTTAVDINTEFGTKYRGCIWRQRLEKVFGHTIVDKIKHGLSSEEELLLFQVLKFYFNNKVVNNVGIEGVFYDFLIGEKVLIEYDGEYWHSNTKERDLYKDRLAKKLGYKIYRIPRKTRLDISHIQKIKELVDEIQTN